MQLMAHQKVATWEKFLSLPSVVIIARKQKSRYDAIDLYLLMLLVR